VIPVPDTPKKSADIPESALIREKPAEDSVEGTVDTRNTSPSIITRSPGEIMAVMSSLVATRFDPCVTVTVPGSSRQECERDTLTVSTVDSASMAVRICRADALAEIELVVAVLSYCSKKVPVIDSPAVYSLTVMEGASACPPE